MFLLRSLISFVERILTMDWSRNSVVSPKIRSVQLFFLGSVANRFSRLGLRRNRKSNSCGIYNNKLSWCCRSNVETLNVCFLPSTSLRTKDMLDVVLHELTPNTTVLESWNGPSLAMHSTESKCMYNSRNTTEAPIQTPASLKDSFWLIEASFAIECSAGR